MQVTSQGGSQPRWREDGKELFYVTPDARMTAVEVFLGDEIRFGPPRELFRLPVFSGRVGPYEYDVSEDGQRFIMRTSGADQAIPITVVLNWLDEL